jgi:archaellum component FlaC
MRILCIIALMTLSSCGLRHSGNQLGVEDTADTLKAINTKLERLNQKQGIVTIASRQVETVTNVAENRRIQSRIIRNIALIDSVLNDHRARISSLEKQLGESRKSVRELEQNLSDMPITLEARQMEIERLRGGIERSGSTIAALHDSLRSVYLVAARTDSLERWKIIEKNGGVTRLFGSSFRLSGHLPLKKFTRIDKLKTSRIMIPASARNVVVMTLHDRNAYFIQDDNATDPDRTRQPAPSCALIITDPVKFWAASSALVIKIDN